MVFDFCPNSHSAIEIAPDEPSVVSMNGWDFSAKPTVPYRAKFRLTLSGLRYYQNPNGTLDVTTNPTMNAGRLLNFYKTNRRYQSFTYAHEYLGTIECRFAEPVNLPVALPNSGGLLPDVEVVFIHHNPGY